MIFWRRKSVEGEVWQLVTTPAALLLTIKREPNGWVCAMLGRTEVFGHLSTDDAKAAAAKLLANELFLMSKELDRGIQSEGDSRLDRTQRETLDKR